MLRIAEQILIKVDIFFAVVAGYSFYEVLPFIIMGSTDKQTNITIGILAPIATTIYYLYRFLERIFLNPSRKEFNKIEKETLEFRRKKAEEDYKEAKSRNELREIERKLFHRYDEQQKPKKDETT